MRFKGVIARLAVGIGLVALLGAAIIAINVQRAGVQPMQFGQHGLSFSYTVKYLSFGAPGATTVSPDIDVPTTSADLLHGVDGVMAALER